MTILVLPSGGGRARLHSGLSLRLLLDRRFRGIRRLDRSLAGDPAIFDDDHHRSAGETTTTTSLPVTTTTTTASTTTTAPSTTSTTLAGVSFPDVPPAHRFYEEIVGLASAGVVSGYDDGLFYPNDLVTRAQFAKIIVLALGRHTAEIDNVADPTFTDVRYAGSDYPFDYVEEAAGLDIIQGYSDGRFGPQANVIRAQLALMLVRAGGSSLEQPPADYSGPFADVPTYAREAVRIAFYNGLLSGKTTAVFDPYGNATRGHVAKMVYELRQVLGL